MTVSLIGEVVNSCDAVTGFSTGNISGDDDFVEGTGAIGVKASNTTVDMFTTSLGAGAPYDFSSTGPEAGYHIILWFNTKTPVNATTGLGVYVGDSGAADFGIWDVIGTSFYKGGFTTRVIDTAADFDTATGFTTTGNPAQLTNINEMGGRFVTITSIMGSFNNVQLDQITIGEGLRVDAGTVGTPNTFETVRAADEDTNFWGWWSSSNGAVIGKGKLYIGPATGTATSVFNDSAFSVIFADERVASDFYEINIRGDNTDVDWTLANISNAGTPRWGLTVDTVSTPAFTDTNGVWTGGGALVLNATSSLSGTTLIDCTSLDITAGATMTNCSVISANTADGVAFVTTEDLDDITNTSFEFSDGHAIEYAPVGAGPFTETLDGNSFTGYGAIGTNDAALYINPSSSTADITINVQNGATPSYRLAAGYTGTFAINQTVTAKVTAQESDGTKIQDCRVRVEAAPGGDLPSDDVVTITTSGTTASVSHTAHGLSNGDFVIIRGANEPELTGRKTISNVTANAYDYTITSIAGAPGTGTITSTASILSGFTDVNGVIQDTGFNYTSDQPVRGVSRKGETAPFYKESPITGTITSGGLDVTVTMTPDG